MLADKIKQDMIKAWKAGETLKKETLSFLLSKIKNKAIELKVEVLPDSDVLAIIQKSIKELQDEGDNFIKANRHDKATEIYKQGLILSLYLPKQLSEAEIRAEIAKLEDKSVPSVMKHFKANFAGQVDMSVVSKVAREG